jgi:hypothetical protein
MREEVTMQGVRNIQGGERVPNANPDPRPPANRRDVLLDLAERHAAAMGMGGDSYAELFVATALTPGGSARQVVDFRLDAVFEGMAPASAGAS